MYIFFVCSQLINYRSSFGIVLSGNSTRLQHCFLDYLVKQRSLMTELLKTYTKTLPVSNKAHYRNAQNKFMLVHVFSRLQCEEGKTAWGRGHGGLRTPIPATFSFVKIQHRTVVMFTDFPAVI